MYRSGSISYYNLFFSLTPMSSSRLKSVATGLVGLVALTSLTGCGLSLGTKSDDIAKVQNLESRVNQLQTQLDEAKKTQTPTPTTSDTTTTLTTPATSTTTTSTTPVVTEKKPASDTFIVIEKPLNQQSVYEYPVQFTGHLSPNGTKVTVRATSSGHTNVDEYTLLNYKAGATTFSYGASPAWNNLSQGSNTYIFTAYFTDGTTKSTSHTLYYSEGGAEMGKPVIYLYPTKTTSVSVNVKPTGGISVSIPEIGKGWNVTATPEGRITNRADQKVYPYLFWEGFAANFITPQEGFVVAKNQVSSFFDEKLAYMGMNQKEIADFKEFWVPHLGTKPYYFITFIDQESIDRYAPLTVSPKPDTAIRVFFDYKGLDQPMNVIAQKLKAGLRNGFTLIEWGGRLYR